MRSLQKFCNSADKRYISSYQYNCHYCSTINTDYYNFIFCLWNLSLILRLNKQVKRLYRRRNIFWTIMKTTLKEQNKLSNLQKFLVLLIFAFSMLWKTFSMAFDSLHNTSLSRPWWESAVTQYSTNKNHSSSSFCYEVRRESVP